MQEEEQATAPEPSVDKPLEMLTVKECAALVDGLSENTVRQLVAQDKVAHVRAGAGRNGKILVSKVSLLKDRLSRRRYAPLRSAPYRADTDTRPQP